MKKLIAELARREGKKSQAKIGEIRELLKHLRDILIETQLGQHDLIDEFFMYSDKELAKRANKVRRAEAKKAKKV